MTLGETSTTPPDRVTACLVLLGVIFVALKLAHVIDWPWWLVTMPWWGAFAIVAAIFVVLGVAAVINAILP